MGVVTFTPLSVMCYFPITIKRDKTAKAFTDKALSSHKVPCGKCEACIRRRQAGWSFRLHNQMLHSTTAAFFTFTYGENYDPKTGLYLWGSNPDEIQVEGGTYQTLNYDHILRFHNHFRRKYGIRNFKYYTVGEYGGKNWRPHFHSIMFNVPMEVLRRSKTVAEQDWTHGNVDIAECNLATINYTTGYFFKGAGLMKYAVPIERQKAVMSKGLGSGYLTDENIEYHKQTLDTSLTFNGYKIAMPRYYRERIFDSDELKALQLYWNEKFDDPYENDIVQHTKSRHAAHRLDVKIQQLNEKSI